MIDGNADRRHLHGFGRSQVWARRLAEYSKVGLVELEDSLARVKRLETLLPICSYCKKIRDEQNHWHQIESYISSHSETEFSHGICTECYRMICEPELQQLELSIAKCI